MELKQMWMTADPGGKSRCGLRVAAGVLGIPLLMLALILGGVLLRFRLSLPPVAFSLALVCAVTALGTALAVGVGGRSVRDATVFFLTGDDRLFAADLRTLTYRGQGVTGCLAGARETQALLRSLARRPRLPAGAEEILKVEGVRENRTCYAVRCQVRGPGGRAARRTRFVGKGCPEADLLLRELERRRTWAGALEPGEDRTPARLLVSVLVCAAFVLLCVLSHPAVGRLPRALYIPCLVCAFAAACAAVCLLICLRRGE